jgi:hypothetical protein
MAFPIETTVKLPGRFWIPLWTILAAFSHIARAQDLEQIANQKPVEVHGGIDARAIFYDANGITPRYLPFNYYLTGSPVLSLYGIEIPVYFSFSRQQNSFSQPFNQFGLSPHYKWITLHAGYRNLQYSPFTLAGHTFLGGGVDLRPGKWRVSGMYGRFNKATVLDTLQGIYIENFSFKRTGYAFKIGYGTSERYIDFIALHAKDHAGSSPVFEKNWLDSMKITPAENLVSGYQMRYTFFDGKISLESDGAFSVYTADARLDAIADSASVESLEAFENFITTNYSTEVYAAFQVSATYRLKLMSFKLQYRYVEPGYQSMGSYFLNNDLENWTINPSLILRKGSLRFTGSLGFQRDNLQDLKRATSHRVIGAVNLAAELTDKLGVDLSYTNFSNTQRARVVRFADSLRVAQSTQNFSFSPRYIKTTALRSYSILLSFNFNKFQELNTERTLEGTGNDILTQTYFATYQVGFLASRSSLFATINYARLGNDSIKDQNSGLTIGGTKSFSSNRIIVTGSSGYIFSNRNGGRGHILNESLQARFIVHPKHSFQSMIVFLGNYPDKESELQRKFTEIRAELGYNFNF